MDKKTHYNKKYMGNTAKDIQVSKAVLFHKAGLILWPEAFGTSSSHRYLPLLESVKADLLDLMESQKELGIYSENGYVFTWEDGRVYRPDYMSKLFKKAVQRCGKVPEDLTLHGLRHSCCAILFEEGWDLGKVQSWLGHSDISVTADIYNHVSKKWRNKHGVMVDEIFGQRKCP